MKFYFGVISTLLCTVMITACATSSYQPIKNPAKLKVTFVNANWDGLKVPKDKVCNRGGAQGSSPKLKVEGIPANTNAIVVEFNDENYAPLSRDGGHGAIWVSVFGQNTIIVPSVETESDDMPQGVNIVHKHRGNGSGIGRGVYLAPCSNGRGHKYVANVMAVYKATSDQEASKLLARGQIVLGRY